MKYSNQVVFGLMLILTVHGLLILSASSQQPYDFFYLVQQWPGSFCSTIEGCCYYQKPAVNFTIHGLWPTRNSGSYPQFCLQSSPFDRSKIMDLTNQLESHWPSISCPPTITSEGFWQYEWRKHGTCSEPVVNFHDYFQKTIDLKMRIDILKALHDKGIYPNGLVPYYLSDIKAAISNVNGGFDPRLECNYDQYGYVQLYEIWLCVDFTGTNFIQCPPNVPVVGRSCGSSSYAYVPVF